MYSKLRLYARFLKATYLKLHSVLGNRCWGHPLGSSAILETIATVLGISRGFVPPSVNCENLDPECGFLRVVRSARAQRIQVALKNSFSLGNRNTSLIFQGYQYP